MKKIALLCLSLVVAQSAIAEQVIEEIVVTATKRATSPTDVPFSLNVQTEEDIKRAGASNIEELSRNIAVHKAPCLVPGLWVALFATSPISRCWVRPKVLLS